VRRNQVLQAIKESKMSFNPTRAGLVPVLLSAFALSSTAALAAGSQSGGHGHPEFGEPGKAADARRTVEVVMGDVFYEPGNIAVVEGETVRFVIRNEGSIVHEFNIGTPHMHAEHQKEMQMMVDHGVLEADRINHDMMKMDMGNGHTMEHDDPNSVLLEPGKSAEIVWKFKQAMDLEFACNVPGHYDAGMAGSFEFVNKLAKN
jgi:uncharacterized cupredoxin-like copper-binding protein